ncbi:gibberellin 20-oxidase, putative [Paecilomyces variotii No. 5]|uniref:Gibberellin 20-oxidase, putative n=1 Tax=Byssochlamys spectabilis (strain No. 5 / NBRC 109023) TaxID=1356009 RepID=V5FE57_BYSSN|nr:gibberellin 20-oxidase, putative [Paecilomyces variotii No. 5]
MAPQDPSTATVINGTSSPAFEIPTVDFSAWRDSNGEARLRVAQDLVRACKDVGFVYIINHGLDESVLQEAFSWLKRLFSLSQEDKMRAPHPDGWAVHRGYSWPGLEKVSQEKTQGDSDDDEELVKKLRKVVDCKESFDIGSENNPDQPNQWIPEDVIPGFRDFMNSFYWECFNVGGEILRAIALGVGLAHDENYLLKKHSGNNNQLRLLHYPAVPAEELESQRMARCPAHTDWSSITMLFQDDCGGLEVEDITHPGTFVPATPIKNAIIMNVGDLLQMWSNDTLRSTNHLVSLPPLSDRFEGPNRVTRERYSIPYFLSPDPTSLIECIPACMSEQNPAKYEPITQAEYNRMRASVQY